MKAIRFLALLTFLAGCCDSESPRVDGHYTFSECCLLEITSIEVTRDGTSARKADFKPCRGGGKALNVSGVAVCIEPDVKSVYVDVTNNSGAVVSVDVPQSYFSSEQNASMPAYAYPLATVPPLDWKNAQTQKIENGRSLSLVFQPIEKSYWVASGCREGVWYKEALLPENLADLENAEARVVVQKLIDPGEDLRFSLPLTIGQSQATIRVGLSLYDRWKEMRDSSEP